MFENIEELKTYLFESGYPVDAVWAAVEMFEVSGDGEAALETALRIVNVLYDVQLEEMGDF
jgi:hypothetical protein